MTDSILYTFSKEDSRDNYLKGFWGWIEILERGDFDLAARSLDVGDRRTWSGPALRKRIENFFGDQHPMTVVIPNQRLVGVINEAAEVAMPAGDRPGWLLAQIPLTNEPSRSKEDDVLLMGAAISLFVVEKEQAYGFDFEIFHL